MTTLAMRKKLVDYLQTADDKKVRAIYTIMEGNIETGSHDADKEIFEELQHRTKYFLDGSAKMYTLEEAKTMARERINATSK